MSTWTCCLMMANGATIAPNEVRRRSVPHKYVWVPTIITVCVSLAACERHDERTSARSKTKTAADAAYSDGYGLFRGAYGLGDDATRNCADDSEVFSECAAPLDEPASPAQSQAGPSETLCAATGVGAVSLAIADTSEIHNQTMDGKESTRAPSTPARRCDMANSSTNARAETAEATPEEAASCSCGKQLCMCG